MLPLIVFTVFTIQIQNGHTCIFAAVYAGSMQAKFKAELCISNFDIKLQNFILKFGLLLHKIHVIHYTPMQCNAINWGDTIEYIMHSNEVK